MFIQFAVSFGLWFAPMGLHPPYDVYLCALLRGEVDDVYACGT